MHKKIYVFVILILIICIPAKALEKPQINASTAVVIDSETGQVLFNKNMHIKRPPASTTKILTAIIAIEEGNLDDVVTVSKKAAYQEGSSIWLEPGEKITLGELVYAIMLSSGNDAAVAIAEHISGSVEKFSELMNKKAKEMGALNSTFMNPNGLPCSGHLSTAYDLAMIMKYGMQNKTFAEITATKYKTISWDGHNWDRGLRNHNKLLWSYEGITGGKTGYTKAAGRCLVSSASKNGDSAIAVVLNCPDDWLVSKQLLDFGLNNFNKKTIFKKGENVYTLKLDNADYDRLELLANKPLTVKVPRRGKISIKKEIIINSDLKLPIKKGEVLGKLIIYNSNLPIGKIKLIANRNITFGSPIRRIYHKLIHLIDRN